jgi:chaperonin GroEL
VVPGDALAYIRALPALERLQLDGERQVDVATVQRALEEPMRQIALNVGAEGAAVVQRCKAESHGIGYDAATATSTQAQAHYSNAHMGEMDF